MVAVPSSRNWISFYSCEFEGAIKKFLADDVRPFPVWPKDSCSGHDPFQHKIPNFKASLTDPGVEMLGNLFLLRCNSELGFHSPFIKLIKCLKLQLVIFSLTEVDSSMERDF